MANAVAVRPGIPVSIRRTAIPRSRRPAARRPAYRHGEPLPERIPCLSPRMETSRVRLRTAQKKAAQSMSRLVALVKSIKASIWTKSRARKAGRRRGLMPN